ncbi:MAG TPA: response regulator transcription factor [Micavibrio sp.]|nr:response regulator transcription factor [Micavibrio sp.]HIL28820.1 response regulator transcription factor [Micavibrio sp.]
MNIVIVEDQAELSALIAEQLKKAGIRAECAASGEAALDLISPDVHDLVILDRGLPDMEGLELLKILREDGVKIPVLVLTAKDELGDKVAGLNSGADDYLVKPFEMDELIARIHALHRRPSQTVDTIQKLGNLEFMPSENLVRINDKPLEISVKEKEALERLMRLPGRVVSKDTLISGLYGYGDEGSQNSVEVLMHRLRKKLEDKDATVEIKTLRGIGYLIKVKDDDG